MESHKLKSWPEFFEAILEGRKRHEIRRRDDRDFRVGNILLLQEFNPNLNEYTGREIKVEVTYITSADNPCALSPDALKASYCILSIRLIGDAVVTPS